MFSSPFVALIKKDLKGYFDQPTGYLLLVIFVAISSWSFFKTAFLIGEASLQPLFTVEFSIDRPSLPWLMTLFIPAATMRLLSEEQRDGTLETLLTHPIRAWVILLSKFLSGLIFVTVAVLVTLGIPLSLTTAGDMDWGAITSQYFGSIFLGASLVAIGLFTSSLTRNQIISFILGLTLGMILMIMGLEIVAITLPPNIASLLQLLSPITHFDNISRGLIDLRDIMYFSSLIATFLTATFLIMRSKTLSHESQQYLNLRLGVTGLIILSILVGWFGTSIQGRLDLTEDKIFTLSPATKEIVESLDDLLTIDLYLSDDPPVQVASVYRDVNDFLDDLESRSNNKIKVTRHYPEDNPQDYQKAFNAGIEAVGFERQSQGEFQIKTGYLGVSLTYLDKRKVIPFVETINGFEYKIASLTDKMISIDTDRLTIGVLQGHGELSPTEQMLTFFSVLNEEYDLLPLESDPNETLPLEFIDILFIGSPSEPMSDMHVNSIDRYLDNGGKALINLQPVLMETDANVGFVGVDNRHSFNNYVSSKYGVIVESNLVYDTQSNVDIPFTNSGIVLPYPYWVRAQIANNNIASNANSLVMPWASSIGILNQPKSEYEIMPLIRTSEFASVDNNYNNLNPIENPIFENTLQNNNFQSDLGVSIKGNNNSRVIVVGDAEWLTDVVINNIASTNGLIGLNFIDWLTEEDTLASVRSKIVSERNLIFSSDSHKNIIRYINIAGIPFLLIIFGFLKFIQRRNKGFKSNLGNTNER